MKKFLALVLVLVLVASCFAGCGKTEAQKETTKKIELTTVDISDKTIQNEGITFTMGVDPVYDPFSYMGNDGEYTGFDVEICKACCDYLGWDFQIFAVEWANKLIQLDAGECDCVWSGMTILPSMIEDGYIISTPYFQNDQVMVVKAGSDIKSSEDLAGKTVAVELGTSGETLLNEDLTDLSSTFGELKTCDSFLMCFTELEGGAVDAVVVDKPVAQKYASEHDTVIMLDEILGTEEYGIAFRADDESLCHDIEIALLAIVENGTYAEIAAKYDTIEQSNLTYLNK